jgi:acetyl-CoA C-acetyltransferase
MGQVLQGNAGQAPARQAAILAGLDPTVEAITINKVCSSGLKAVVFAAQNIQLGLAEAQVAGGMESMTQVPYYLPRSSQLPAFGNFNLEDGLIKDGLWDVYNKFHMGVCAEKTAAKYNVSREDQDEYAIRSYQRAQQAWKDDKFADEIAPVTVKGKKGDTVVSRDEGYENLQIEKLKALKPAFIRDGTGTVTAGNASSLNDGASALVLANHDLAQQYGSSSRVLARIVSSADAAIDPVDFPIAPAKAVPIALERAGITKDQVAVWEFNEAFAAVIKANEKVWFLHLLCSTSSHFSANMRTDSGPAKRPHQPSRWCYLPGSPPRKLWLEDFDDFVAPTAARRIWRSGYLQRRWRRDGCRCAEAGEGRVNIMEAYTRGY